MLNGILTISVRALMPSADSNAKEPQDYHFKQAIESLAEKLKLVEEE